MEIIYIATIAKSLPTNFCNHLDETAVSTINGCGWKQMYQLPAVGLDLKVISVSPYKEVTHVCVWGGGCLCVGMSIVHRFV